MSPDNSQRSRTTPRWPVSWIAAAVALVLNWTLPAPLLPDAIAAGESGPGLSSGVRAAPPGTLPRLQPRSIPTEAGGAERPQVKLSVGDKSDAVLPRDCIGAAAVDVASVPPEASTAVPAVRATRSYNPRAPPASA